MKRRRWSPWLELVSLLVVHAAIISIAAIRLAGSDLAMLVSALCAATACAWRGWRMRRGSVALQWHLAAAGVLLWVVGQALFTYFDVRHLPETTAIDSDFYFFLFGVPFLLAICSVEGQRNVRALTVTDMLQAFMVAWLVRVELFPAQPGELAISVERVSYAYNIESVLLIGAAGLRLLSGSRGKQGRFYRVIFGFLTAYGLLSTPLNYLNVKVGLPTGTYLDLFWDLPFLLLAGWALSDSSAAGNEEEAPSPTRLQLIILHTMPVLITAVVLVMGTFLVRYSFSSGLLAILVGLGSYSLRNSMLELRYLNSQKRLTESERALQEANERLQQLSYIDPLTKVANRRRFEEALVSEWFRTMRREAPLSLLMMDLDHFKMLNDHYGHLRGDDCLAMAAQTLQSYLRRAGELIARYGGEEFAAILPDVGPEDAMQVAEELRTAIYALEVENQASPHEGRLTLSIGVATCFPSNDFQVGDLIAAADQALYAAKEAGRNQVRESRLFHASVRAIIEQATQPMSIEEDFRAS